jgi:uncharacterized protein
MAALSPPSLVLDELPLVDHHCHSVVDGELDRAAFEALLTEAAAPAPGLSSFDSLLGWSVRRWCAPLLDLPPFADAEDYLERRRALGTAEVTRRLMTTTGTASYLLDTGFRSEELLPVPELGRLAGASTHEIVRLETLVERVADGGVTAASFGSAVGEAVAASASAAVGLKSVAAYRVGLDLPPVPPTPLEAARAADEWLPRREREGARLDSPVLVWHAVWAGVETGLPIQFHAGLGDADEDLRRANPARLTAFARAAPSPVVLLHCYPYHRQAAWLAHVLPNVWFDLGLATGYVGARASAVLAEALELAPFGKLLYSSDAFGLPELYTLGALRFRRAAAEVLGTLLDAGETTEGDVRRLFGMVAAGNARRLYRLADR